MTRAKCDSEFYPTTAEKYYEVKPSAETALFLAQAFQNKQEYDKAIKYLTEALAVETDNVEKEKLLVRIGVVQLATKNYAEARKAALEAQALNPEDGMTYFVLAQCYGAQASGANFTSQAMYWVAYDTMERDRDQDDGRLPQRMALEGGVLLQRSAGRSALCRQRHCDDGSLHPLIRRLRRWPV